MLRNSAEREVRGLSNQDCPMLRNSASGRRSVFRAGFRPDSNRENLKIGSPVGGPILKLPRLESGRNLAREPPRLGDLWMWPQIIWLQLEVVRSPVGVAWGRSVAGWGPSQTGPKSTLKRARPDLGQPQPHEL